MPIHTLECPLNRGPTHTGPTDTGGFGRVGGYHIENGRKVPDYVLTAETIRMYEVIEQLVGASSPELRKENKNEEKK
ncbi:MAG: hypothetical protein WC784_00615 [Candidatus Shapirobacteria bacterium]|jgi:hypothetical protein